MFNTLFLIPFGLLAIPLLLYLRRYDRATAGSWTGAAVVFFAAGILSSAAALGDAPLVAAHAMGPVCTALIALGVYPFTGRKSPAWIPIVGGIGALVVWVTHSSMGLASSGIATGLFGVPLLSLAAALVWRHARATRASLPERALGPALFAAAGLFLADVTLRSRFEAHEALLACWIVASLLIAFLAVTSLAERSRASRERLAAERELLRRVTHVLADSSGPHHALARLAAAVKEFESFLFLGIWVVSDDGSRFELLPDPSGQTVMPSQLRAPPLDHPMAKAALESDGVLFLDDISRDARADPVAARFGTGAGFLAPLRAGDRNSQPLGIMAAAFLPTIAIDAEQRRFAADLADEVALVLANLALARSERERTQALDDERQTLRALIESSPVGILLADPEGRIRFLNDRIAAMGGLLDAEEWLGRETWELFGAVQNRVSSGSHEEIERRRSDFDNEQGVSPWTLEVELQIAHSSDPQRTLSVVAVPVEAPGGRHLGRLWMVRDVSEERRLAEHLQHAERMDTLGTLAGGLAHDFNNQLTAILGNAGILLEDRSPGDPVFEVARELEHAAEHCAQLTQGLLTFARQSASVPSPADTSHVIEEVASLLGPALPPEAVLEIDVAPDLGYCHADPVQLRRVLTNLAMNARDAIGPAGRVRIHGGRAAEDPSALIELRVEDDGTGMDEATRRRIFDPFFTTKDVGRGTGLGLSVAYGIVEAHGGSITVDSQPNEGSSFRILWPASQERPQPPKPEPVELRAPNGQTVLLAEDEPKVRRLARRCLERAGYRVIEAADGAAAIQGFRTHKDGLSLALLDLSMPKKSGLEVIDEIRAHAPQLPAIVMSGHPERFADALAATGAVLLPKPFAPRALLASVESALATRKDDTS